MQCDHALLFQLASWTPWPRWGWQRTVTASATSSVSSIRRLSMAGRYIGKLKSPFLLLFHAAVATSACGQGLATQTALQCLELLINWAFEPITWCQMGCHFLPLVLTLGLWLPEQREVMRAVGGGVWQALTQEHVQAHPRQSPTWQNGVGAEPTGHGWDQRSPCPGLHSTAATTRESHPAWQ